MSEFMLQDRAAAGHSGLNNLLIFDEQCKLQIQKYIYLNVLDLGDKLQTYNKINGAIRRHFGKQMNKETKLRIHNITAKAALKFGSEAWVLKKREEQRLESAQMKFLRQLLGITKLDKEKNQCIREKTGVKNMLREIKQYQKKWLQHVQRMDTSRLSKQTLKCRPEGRRNIGRPKKRWRDQLHFED